MFRMFLEIITNENASLKKMLSQFQSSLHNSHNSPTQSTSGSCETAHSKDKKVESYTSHVGFSQRIALCLKSVLRVCNLLLMQFFHQVPLDCVPPPIQGSVQEHFRQDTPNVILTACLELFADTASLWPQVSLQSNTEVTSDREGSKYAGQYLPNPPSCHRCTERKHACTVVLDLQGYECWFQGSFCGGTVDAEIDICEIGENFSCEVATNSDTT